MVGCKLIARPKDDADELTIGVQTLHGQMMQMRVKGENKLLTRHRR